MSFNNIGGILRAKGKLGDALTAFEQSMAIAKRLSEQDPTNADWQRDLSVSLNNMGDVLKAKGKLDD